MIFKVADASRFQCRAGADISVCSGPSCAMWRWAASGQAYQKNPRDRPGYCGLAGKPEFKEAA